MTSHAHESHDMDGRHAIKTKMLSLKQDGTAELHVNSTGIWHVRLHCSNYSVQCVKGTGSP